MAAKFYTPLSVHPIDQGRKWQLDAPLIYRSELAGRIQVPTGFIFDGNSLPRLAWIVSPPTEFLEAGCLHDFLYWRGGNRATADAVYREALTVLGMGKVRRNLRYAAVRAFGWLAYRG